MRQQIGFKQGALAPLAASVALFGGFLLIKYLPWINLQTLSNAYFFLIGSAAVTGALLPPLRHAVSMPAPPLSECLQSCNDQVKLLISIRQAPDHTAVFPIILIGNEL